MPPCSHHTTGRVSASSPCAASRVPAWLAMPVAEHAFGEDGLEGVVPPRSDMILQVELLKVQRSSWYSCAIL